VFQPGAVVNYPNEQPYTRITEFKYLTGQKHPKTSIVYEFPKAEGDPYYPVPRPENTELYKRYQALADGTPNVHFIGRLATYKYYNMDQVTAQALSLFAKLSAEPRVKVHAQTNGNGRRKQLVYALPRRVPRQPALDTAAPDGKSGDQDTPRAA
jgi:UDP-galactopyranose mutase